MARHKDFGGGEEQYEEVSFTLWKEDFQCYEQVQGVSLLGFVQEAASGDGARAAQALLGFFERVMPPEEFVRFDELWNDPKRIVPIDKIAEIAEWLTEVYTERNPTQESPTSSTGQKRPGRTPKDRQRSAAATSGR
jgi:hypothetical protein